MVGKLEALELWRSVLVTSVRQAGPDLTARQLALLLTVYLTAPPHTVRGLAQILSVSKPAISRGLDRLGQLGFLRRKRDETDRRNVLIQRTVKGSVYLTEFSSLVESARMGQLRVDGPAVAMVRMDAEPRSVVLAADEHHTGSSD